MYKEMSAAEGGRCLLNVWNMLFRSLVDENFFVEPWENRELSDCAGFQPGSERDQLDRVFFFTTDEELIGFLKGAEGELYLFGAYNQVRVCQVRARGTVKFEEGHPETEQIRNYLYDAIEARVGASNHNKLSGREAEERYAILENGLLFCFRISSYAYHVYERG